MLMYVATNKLRDYRKLKIFQLDLQHHLPHHSFFAKCHATLDFLFNFVFPTTLALMLVIQNGLNTVFPELYVIDTSNIKNVSK